MKQAISTVYDSVIKMMQYLGCTVRVRDRVRLSYSRF